jgi:hypothetical protein
VDDENTLPEAEMMRQYRWHETDSFNKQPSKDSENSRLFSSDQNLNGRKNHFENQFEVPAQTVSLIPQIKSNKPKGLVSELKLAGHQIP